MAANPARDAAVAGARLIGRSPLAFLAWIAVRLAEQYAALAVLLGAHLAHSAIGVGPVWAVLLAVPFEAVLVSAILRAELRPQERAFAFLRLGRIEANMAGLLILAGLAGAVVAVPVLILVAYAGLGLKSAALAGSAPFAGSIAAGLVLMRFAPAPAILVDERRVDLAAAWRASKGRYGVLIVVVVGAMVAESLLGAMAARLASQPGLAAWSDLLSPGRLIILLWRSLTGVAALALMAGAAATVWRESKTTLS